MWSEMGSERGELQSVLAWVEDDVEIVRHRRHDLGERPVTRPVKVAKTALWLNRGTEADVEAARAYAAREGYRVYAYPSSERDARGRAEREVLNERK